MIIDAHLHLWDRQCGRVDEKPVFALCEGKSNFGGEIRQMMPPYMLDGRNTAEMLIANMNYARVSGFTNCDRTFRYGYNKRVGRADRPCPAQKCLCGERRDHMVVP